MMTKDNPGVWANGGGAGGGGGVGLGMHYPCLAWPDFPTEKGMVFRVLSVQFYYLASLTGFVLGTEEYDGCR